MLNSLKPVSKAIAGTLAGLIVAFLMKHNIVIADGLSDALEVVISAVIVGVVVYFAPKNEETK
jgi:hypothetical protein